MVKNKKCAQCGSEHAAIEQCVCLSVSFSLSRSCRVTGAGPASLRRARGFSEATGPVRNLIKAPCNSGGLSSSDELVETSVSVWELTGKKLDTLETHTQAAFLLLSFCYLDDR